MFQVRAQLNSGDPCPKREHRAWCWEESEHETLSDAIAWLLENKAVGFVISENGAEIAFNVVRHY